ncbi:MAG: M48 family metallopeptidase [Chromatiales bacterium]|jgi:predicted Zn-dependent protease|nr:M48 family metallopeptidase [Chromatiales bacterium]
MTRHHKFALVTIGVTTLLIAGCATSPTGQRQLRLFPESQMVEMGATAFKETREKTPLAKNPAMIAYVQCVAAAVARESGANTQWEVEVFESDQANAFALPGGKIGVYSGMLKVAGNQDQLAAVLGHEVTHVTAQHGNARVSANYAAQAGLGLVQALSGEATPLKQQAFALLGLGAQYGIVMPYGRGQETEADILGLNLMARAGFDPREAPELWANMARASGGKGPPAFLSTHPSNEGRIATLQKHMGTAMATFEAARRAGKQPRCR